MAGSTPGPDDLPHVDVDDPEPTIAALAQQTRPAPDGVFCAIAARAWRAWCTRTRPRWPPHAVGLEGLDGAAGAPVWSVGHGLARALRRSAPRPEGIDVFLCDGEVALQTVLHLRLHVLPRYPGVGWSTVPDTHGRPGPPLAAAP